MVTDKLVLSVQMFLLAVLLSCWYGSILPSFLETGAINFIYAGVCGATLLIATAIIIFWNKNWKIVIRSAVFFINLVILLVLFIPSIPVYLVPLLNIIAALFQGLLLGGILQRSLKSSFLGYHVSFLALGSIGVLIAQYLPYNLIGNKTATSVQINFASNNFILILIMIMILLVSGILDLRFKSESDREYKGNNIDFTLPVIVKYAVFVNAVLLVLIEIIFCFWSAVLLNVNQSLINSLTFPLSVCMIFIFRVLLKNVGQKMVNPGWFFALSVVSTVSLGLLYTFNFTPLFILGFGFSMAYLLWINNHLFYINADSKNVAFLLITASVVMVIAGLYIQNYVEFIRSIKIPKDLITLSARQALVKEMASFAAVSVILSGYLFLKRRTIFVNENVRK